MLDEEKRIFTNDNYQTALMLLNAQTEDDFQENGLDLMASKLLLDQVKKGDARATFLTARLMLEGIFPFLKNKSEEIALGLLMNLADRGHVPSRILLNQYCADKYQVIEDEFADSDKDNTGLRDFNGKLIKIDKKGIFTPVDAKLETIKGKNILTLSLNLAFLLLEQLPIDEELFKRTIIDGIKEWEGEYTVFGGQKLSVVINVTTENRWLDNVMVIPITDMLYSSFTKQADILKTKKSKDIKETIVTGRSFAVSGIKWSANSLKFIYINDISEDMDLKELRAVAKHEFGHVLGLGDLYAEPEKGLEGVEKGNYRELDCYYINNKLYNLVMCDHRGPISNNDIEMVVLAFRENKAQNYQVLKRDKRISEALGKGN